MVSRAEWILRHVHHYKTLFLYVILGVVVQLQMMYLFGSDKMTKSSKSNIMDKIYNR